MSTPNFAGSNFPVRLRDPSTVHKSPRQSSHPVTGEERSCFTEAFDCTTGNSEGVSAQLSRPSKTRERLTILASDQQLLDVILNDRVVDRVVSETAPDEERSTLREHGTEDGHVEVLSRDNVR